MLAHGNGLDEIALFVVPVVLFVLFVLAERWRATRRPPDDEPG